MGGSRGAGVPWEIYAFSVKLGDYNSGNAIRYTHYFPFSIILFEKWGATPGVGALVADKSHVLLINFCFFYFWGPWKHFGPSVSLEQTHPSSILSRLGHPEIEIERRNAQFLEGFAGEEATRSETMLLGGNHRKNCGFRNIKQ